MANDERLSNVAYHMSGWATPPLPNLICFPPNPLSRLTAFATLRNTGANCLSLLFPGTEFVREFEQRLRVIRGEVIEA